MKWFKHESNASQDAKLKKLRRRHGMAAVGVYWYILERIMTECEPGNTSLALEDDTETLALDCDMEESDIFQITGYMVELNLLQVGPDSRLVCHQLAKRFDKSQCNHSMRNFVDALRLEHGHETAVKTKVMTNPDTVMTKSGQIREEEIRTDNIRVDENSLDKLRADNSSRDGSVVRCVVDNSGQFHKGEYRYQCQSGEWLVPDELIQQLTSYLPEDWLFNQLDNLNNHSVVGAFSQTQASDMSNKIIGLLSSWWKAERQAIQSTG